MLENYSSLTITLMVVGAVLLLGYFIFVIRGFWMMFDYAGFPGWLSLVPVLNVAISLKIAKMSPYWLFASFTIVLIPVVLIIWLFKICSVYEKNTTYVFISLFFGFITIPLIGYGEKKYEFD